jgi:hypothetical protein
MGLKQSQRSQGWFSHLSAQKPSTKS